MLVVCDIGIAYPAAVAVSHLPIELYGGYIHNNETLLKHAMLQ